MRSKSRWLPLVSCLTAASMLAACGDDAPSNPGGAGASSTAGKGGAANSAGANNGGNSGAGTAGAAAGSSATGGASAGASGTGGAAAGAGGTGGATAGSGGAAAGTGGAGGAAAGTGGAAAGSGGTGGAAAGTGGAAAGSGGTGGSGPICPAPAASHSATACTKSCWKASASDCANYPDYPVLNPPVQAIDGLPTTRWSSGLKQNALSASYTIDLGSSVSVDGLKMDEGGVAADANDFAADYQVDVSTDSTTWTPVACGAGATVTDVAFAPVTARYVRVTQKLSAVKDKWWGVHEFNVYCPTTDTCAGGGTVTGDFTACGVQHHN